jgi:hypothetical protein
LEKRHSEFAELRRNAHEILSGKPVTPITQGLELMLRVIIEPAFQNDVSLMIWHDPIETEYMAQKIIWDKSFDSNRFFNPLDGLKHGWHIVPTIRSQTALLDATAVELLIHEGRKIPSETVVQAPIITDGIRWSIYVPHHFDNRTLIWNSATQDENGLISWTEKIVMFLSDLFSD